MRPRAHDQMARRRRALPVQGPVEVPRPEAVLGIERPADDEHRGLDVVTGTAQVAFLPPGVVIGMRGHLFPEGVGFQQPGKFRKRRMLQEERPLVGLGLPGHGGHFRGRNTSGRGIHAAQEAVGVGEHQHPVVMHVVAHEPIGDGSLRRDGLHGGMAAKAAHHGVEPRIGTPGESHPAVVVRDVPDQPVDRVVAVGRLVDSALAGGGTDVDKLPFAHVAPPHVLQDEDVAPVEVGAQIALLERRGEAPGAVGGATVGGAEDEDGGRFGAARRVDGRVEPYAVARLGRGDAECGQRDEQQRYESFHRSVGWFKQW